MIAALLATGLLIATAPPARATPTIPHAARTAGQDQQVEPVQLEGITVTGQRLEEVIQTFVNEVAEPNRNRGLARWRDSLCIGVTNLQEEAAQYLIDRVSTVAQDVGIRTGQPGCAPNLVIVATEDGDGYARAYVREHRASMRLGGSGMDRGIAALNDFVETSRPVRWWQTSMPTDADTGHAAARIGNDCYPANVCTAYKGNSIAGAPSQTVLPSLLGTEIIDNLRQVLVIVDVDDVSQLSILQLADYIAMISLAQINPDADTHAYVSILNVFNDPTTARNGLTTWDRAYLKGLYGADSNRANQASNRSQIVTEIRQEHERLRGQASSD